MRKKLLTLIGSICLILVLAAMPFLTACPAPPEEVTPPPPEEEKPPPPEEEKPTPEVPELVTVMTYDIGATSYVMHGFLGDAIMKKYGTRLRAIPCGNDVGRFIPLRAGEADFAGEGGDHYFASEGLSSYSTREWGPQALRGAWFTQHPGVTAMVRGTSDIHSLADLKGKRIAWIPGSTMNKMVEGHLAFAGLTWDDVEKVEVPGFGASLRAIIAGKVDMACCANTSTVNYELAASPHGCRFLQMPATDKEGWARAKEVMPFWVPLKATMGPGLSEEHPNECAGFAFPVMTCYPSLDENTAYFMTKAINESYDMMAEGSDLMKAFWKLEQSLSLFEHGDVYIFHRGSVCYLKEIGVWQPEWDKLQADRIAHQDRLKEVWDETLAKAYEEGIKDKDFPAYWLERRAAALGD